MRSATNWSRVRKRHSSLAIKEAIGSITPAEKAKLERYQSLLRTRRTPSEVAREARQDYAIRQAMKALASRP